jgi:hypothetical protein
MSAGCRAYCAWRAYDGSHCQSLFAKSWTRRNVFVKFRLLQHTDTPHSENYSESDRLDSVWPDGYKVPT